MRAWLVGISLVAHIAVLFGLFVAGMWRIDQLDPAKHRIDLAVALPPPPAASGSPALKAQPFTLKRHIIHETVQPVVHVDPVPAAPASEAPGTGTGTGDGTGSGAAGDSGGPCTETCGPGSAAAAPPAAPVVPPQPTMVPPTVLRGLRIAGETQVQPDDAVRSQLARDGKREVRAMFKVCVDTAGGIGSLAQVRSTGYPSYDDQLAAAIRGWRYRPYLANGTEIPVCGVVTFIYGLQ